ncbi:unnamed protein product [Sphagnum balticum]
MQERQTFNVKKKAPPGRKHQEEKLKKLHAATSNDAAATSQSEANLKPNSSKKIANHATNDTQKIRENLFFLKRRPEKLLPQQKRSQKEEEKQRKREESKGQALQRWRRTHQSTWSEREESLTGSGQTSLQLPGLKSRQQYDLAYSWNHYRVRSQPYG